MACMNGRPGFFSNRNGRIELMYNFINKGPLRGL